MRGFHWIAFIVLLTAPHPLLAQSREFRLGTFGGVGVGPETVGLWGADMQIPLSRYLAVRVEYSRWGDGLFPVSCTPTPPESAGCGIRGWAVLAGLRVTPLGAAVRPYADVATGSFVRDGYDPGVVVSPVLAAGLGVEWERSRWAFLAGYRHYRPYDGVYEERIGEPLAYSVLFIGVGYTPGR